MIKRDLLDNITSSCFQGKTILLMGARQVGETTTLVTHSNFEEFVDGI